MSPPPLRSGQLEQEAEGNVRKLKRRFSELREETRSDVLVSSERNVRIREEPENSNEKKPGSEYGQSHSNGFPVDSTSPGVPMTQPSSSILPRKDRDNQKSDLSAGSHSANGDHSESSYYEPHMQPRSSIPDNDVNMNDATASSNNRTSSNILHHLPGVRQIQQDEGHDLRGPDPSAPGPHTRAKGIDAGPTKRSSRQTKGHSEPVSRTTRSGSFAIAAAAAEAAEAEAAAAKARQQASTSNLNAQQDVPVANRITVVTSVNSSKNNPPTKSAGAISSTSFVSRSQASSLESTPSMENIIKVAAAAVAAQNAAAASAAAISSNPSQSHQVADPNLDPNLSSNKGDAASKNLPAVDTKATSSGSNSAKSPATTPSTATSSSSLSNNPYLSLSMLARQSPGSTTSTGHQMMPMYYPPHTLGTPNTPTYSIYGNPYYYLAGPMTPVSNGMFSPLSPGVAFPPPPAQKPPAESPRTPKPKRLKAHTVTTKNFSIPMVPRDKNGKPMLPLNVGIMTVINLGEVCIREHFHTERYIFPVGYEVTRRYLSTLDPGIEVVYHCTILDGGDGPKFQIIPSDRADKPIIAGTATGAWSNIVKQANAIRNRQHSNSVSGPDFFGLGQNTIKHLIQELPNSDRLRDYVWQNFVEGGPLGGRHAAVVPALPEEYDASMPIGAYYPKREVSVNPSVPRGLSHYPQHIIAQAEAQKSQQLATQQAKENSTGPSSSSSPQQQEGSTLPQDATQGHHVQIALLPDSSSKGLNIQQYQPPQQVQASSQGHGKRATRSSTNTNDNTSAPSTSNRSTRASTRGSQRQAQQQQEQASASAPGTSTPSASEAMPTTFVSILSQFPVPGLAGTHPAGS